MEKTTTKDWDYAHWTFRVGTRPFEGVILLLENTRENFKIISSHPCGSFSSTNDLLCRNAFSKISLTMSYALLEGFFIEEYRYYIKSKLPKFLIDVINELLKKHALVLTNWEHLSEKIEMVRNLRNAEMHNNGVISKSFDKEKCKELFGENIFQQNEKYPQLSLESAILLVREFKKIADEYAEAVFKMA